MKENRLWFGIFVCAFRILLRNLRSVVISIEFFCAYIKWNGDLSYSPCKLWKLSILNNDMFISISSHLQCVHKLINWMAVSVRSNFILVEKFFKYAPNIFHQYFLSSSIKLMADTSLWFFYSLSFRSKQWEKDVKYNMLYTIYETICILPWRWSSLFSPREAIKSPMMIGVKTVSNTRNINDIGK